MPRLSLAADCGNCAALCCTWLAFDASEDFAFSKPAGVPCRHLRRDRCAIHDDLAGRGLRGCALYDCHGAGPRATRMFAAAPLTDRERHDAFAILRELHELLWLLDGASALYLKCKFDHDADACGRSIDVYRQYLAVSPEADDRDGV